ncbi:MAG: hypothetical protein AAF125_12870, partial [Chloroflexota bacterium]
MANDTRKANHRRTLIAANGAGVALITAYMGTTMAAAGLPPIQAVGGALTMGGMATVLAFASHGYRLYTQRLAFDGKKNQKTEVSAYQSIVVEVDLPRDQTRYL